MYEEVSKRNATSPLTWTRTTLNRKYGLNAMVLTSIDPTIHFISFLQLPKDPGDFLRGGSVVHPFQGILHGVVGHVVADEHALCVHTMHFVRSNVFKTKR